MCRSGRSRSSWAIRRGPRIRREWGGAERSPPAPGRFATRPRKPGGCCWTSHRPAPAGARLLAAEGAQALPGSVKVVRKGNFLGVVADTEWDAIQAARNLKVTWSPAEVSWPPMADLYRVMWSMPARLRRVLAEV